MKFKLIINCKIFKASKRIISIFLNKDNEIDIKKALGYCEYVAISGEKKKVELDIREIKYRIEENLEIIKNAIAEGKKKIEI